jgi:hypothetical protein
VSIIGDQADSSKTALPIMKNMYSFAKDEKIKQAIYCYINPGQMKIIFRTLTHIQKGENISCHLFLLCLERWVHDHHGLNPEIVDYTTDGGPENVSKNFIAFCAYMLIKRVVTKRITLRRLPKGHTHNSPDAIFGNFYTHARSETVLSPDDYEDLVDSILRQHPYDHVFKDIFVCPNYMQWIEPYRDTTFGGYKQKDHTQLLIHLDYVDGQIYKEFVGDVKLTYQAYAASNVFEIVSTDENDVGLKAINVSVSVEPGPPSADEILRNPVAARYPNGGRSILRSVPDGFCHRVSERVSTLPD